jgi:hypothetical protein
MRWARPCFGEPSLSPYYSEWSPSKISCLVEWAGAFSLRGPLMKLTTHLQR